MQALADVLPDVYFDAVSRGELPLSSVLDGLGDRLTVHDTLISQFVGSDEVEGGYDVVTLCDVVSSELSEGEVVRRMVDLLRDNGVLITSGDTCCHERMLEEVGMRVVFDGERDRVKVWSL